MIEIKENFSLSELTTFHVGGPARYFSEVKTSQELKEALIWSRENKQPFFVLGGGSNVLFSDNGFPGLVIRLKMDQIRLGEDGTSLIAQSGARLAQLVNMTAEKGLTGLEWAAGIPGTVGGAICGNAGAFGSDMGKNVEQLEIWNVSQEKLEFKNQSDCHFAYRSSFFKKNRDQIILSATLRLAKGNVEQIKSQVAENIARRLSKQPKGVMSAGSFFKNPQVFDQALIEKFEKMNNVKAKDHKLPAGWLIDQAELTGKKVDGAMVSLQHGNFIVNTGSAKAENIIILASLIKQKVRNIFGVELEEEVEYVGF